jgi:transcriptional regulator with XRE-family HTH domain
VIDLKEFRRRNNLSQLELADKLDITQAHVSRLENNPRQINETILSKLARIFPNEGIEVNEDQAPYGATKNKSIQYVVSETNQIRDFTTGDILIGSMVDPFEFLPRGIPYIIVTKKNFITLVRYLKNKINEKIQIATEMTGGIEDELTHSDIASMYIINEVRKKVNN